MNSSPLLRIKNLSIQYNTEDGIVHAVEGLNLQVGLGESLGLVGETGAGKTTTALGIMGLVPSPPGKVVSGEIIFEGKDLLIMNKTQMKKIRGKEISMIFQDPMTSLNPVITVENQIAEMIQIHGNVTGSQAKKRAVEMLELVGIRKERAADYPHQFSGGMRQRVMIAIALACEPKLLIADEPTTALDVTIQAQVLSLMRNLKDIFKTSMILITHDLGVVASICEKIGIMYAGRIIEFSSLKNVFTFPRHPYTLGLFNSIPDISSEEKKDLNVIPGLMPDPANLPEGCPFHPRCAFSKDECFRIIPKLEEISEGHFVACHNSFSSPRKYGGN